MSGSDRGLAPALPTVQSALDELLAVRRNDTSADIGAAADRVLDAHRAALAAATRRADAAEQPLWGASHDEMRALWDVTTRLFLEAFAMPEGPEQDAAIRQATLVEAVRQNLALARALATGERVSYTADGRTISAALAVRPPTEGSDR